MLSMAVDSESNAATAPLSSPHPSEQTSGAYSSKDGAPGAPRRVAASSSQLADAEVPMEYLEAGNGEAGGAIVMSGEVPIVDVEYTSAAGEGGGGEGENGWDGDGGEDEGGHGEWGGWGGDASTPAAPHVHLNTSRLNALQGGFDDTLPTRDILADSPDRQR
jgi:hypothetical protein